MGVPREAGRAMAAPEKRARMVTLIKVIHSCWRGNWNVGVAKLFGTKELEIWRLMTGVRGVPLYTDPCLSLRIVSELVACLPTSTRD